MHIKAAFPVGGLAMDLQEAIHKVLNLVVNIVVKATIGWSFLVEEAMDS